MLFAVLRMLGGAMALLAKHGVMVRCLFSPRCETAAAGAAEDDLDTEDAATEGEREEEEEERVDIAINLVPWLHV